jgi:hypothetical protein
VDVRETDVDAVAATVVSDGASLSSLPPHATRANARIRRANEAMRFSMAEYTSV